MLDEKLWKEILAALQENNRVFDSEGGEFYFESKADTQILIKSLHALKAQETGEHTVTIDGVEYVKAKER